MANTDFKPANGLESRLLEGCSQLFIYQSVRRNWAKRNGTTYYGAY